MEDKEWFQALMKSETDNEKMTEKQLRILEAAVEIFAEKGYAATSTSEIAKKAQVAEGTIFKHYKTKKDLLLTISASLLSKLIVPVLVKDLNNIIKKNHDSFEEFLKELIVNRRDFAKNHIELIKVLIQEVPFHPELQEQFKKTVALPFLEQFFQCISRFMEKGEIVDIPVKSAARLMATPVLGYVLMKYILNIVGESNEENDVEELVSFIMNGLKKR